MKRNILLIMFCFVAVVGFGQDKKLIILHTNDTKRPHHRYRDTEKHVLRLRKNKTKKKNN